MKLTIEINCNNAAFADDAAGECARILNHLAGQLGNPLGIYDGHRLFDINGNRVGKLEVSDA